MKSPQLSGEPLPGLKNLLKAAVWAIGKFFDNVEEIVSTEAMPMRSGYFALGDESSAFEKAGRTIKPCRPGGRDLNPFVLAGKAARFARNMRSALFARFIEGDYFAHGASHQQSGSSKSSISTMQEGDGVAESGEESLAHGDGAKKADANDKRHAGVDDNRAGHVGSHEDSIASIGAEVKSRLKDSS